MIPYIKHVYHIILSYPIHLSLAENQPVAPYWNQNPVSSPPMVDKAPCDLAQAYLSASTLNLPLDLFCSNSTKSLYFLKHGQAPSHVQRSQPLFLPLETRCCSVSDWFSVALHVPPTTAPCMDIRCCQDMTGEWRRVNLTFFEHNGVTWPPFKRTPRKNFGFVPLPNVPHFVFFFPLAFSSHQVQSPGDETRRYPQSPPTQRCSQVVVPCSLSPRP